MYRNRSVFFTIALSLVVFSCKKNDSNNTPTSENSSYLASARTYSPGTLLIDSFSYDASHHIARFTQYYMDNTGGNTINDSTIYAFTFSGTNPLPVSYTYTWQGQSEVHQLTFDGQNRIMKDTGVGGSHFVTYYSYPGNLIVNKVLFDGTTDNAQIDSLTVTNGNFTSEKIWGADNGAWSLQADLQYGRSSGANPGYKKEIADAVGPLLYVLSVYNYGGYADYISKGVTNKISGTADGLGSINYAISTDASGRVSTMTPAGAPAGSKTVFKYY